MKKMALLVVLFMVMFPLSVTAYDYTYLDKHGNYRGFSRDSGGRVEFYGRDGRPQGWVDRQSGYVFDRNNNVRGSYYPGSGDNDE